MADTNINFVWSVTDEGELATTVETLEGFELGYDKVTLEDVQDWLDEEFANVASDEDAAELISEWSDLADTFEAMAALIRQKCGTD